MFIINIDKLDNDMSKYYICDETMSKNLLKHGFPLLSAIYSEEKYVFVKTDKLLDFVKKGGE